MTTYDTQLFTFLTKPENFEPFVEMKEQYDKVKQRLINEFWTSVLEEANKMSRLDPRWKFSLDEPNTPNRKLRASHPDISDENFNAGVIYEFLDNEVILGAWFNRSKFVNPAMDSIWASAKIYLASQPATKDDRTWNVGSGGWWFAIYKKPGLNLSQKASLLQVLPDVRASLAKSYAEQFVSAVNQLGSFCLQHAVKS